MKLNKILVAAHVWLQNASLQPDQRRHFAP